MTNQFGLLGEHLGHSFSPALHAMFGDYQYALYEITQKELPRFLRTGEWQGLNVTIPYKKAVLPYCDELSKTAQICGSVNTLIRKADGRIYGDNTDVFGFSSLMKKIGAPVAGKKALVLGSGGASAAVCAALRNTGVETVVVSRTGENNYANLKKHRDATVIVNTTPVGMYPQNGESPIDLQAFPVCEKVFDLVYNPARTALLMQAEALSIPHAGGLCMLCAQGAKSSELFTGRNIPQEKVDEAERTLSFSSENIILVGMPGCGKSTVAAALGRITGRDVLDTDELVSAGTEMPVGAYLTRFGEAAFRRAETEVLRSAGKMSGAIIATGGGCVTVPENYGLLRQNGVIVWLQRDIEKLSAEGRPLSENANLRLMYERRAPLYERFSSVSVRNDDVPDKIAERILCKLK